MGAWRPANMTLEDDVLRMEIAPSPQYSINSCRSSLVLDLFIYGISEIPISGSCFTMFHHGKRPKKLPRSIRWAPWAEAPRRWYKAAAFAPSPAMHGRDAQLR